MALNTQGDSPHVRISYCIPVKNRTDDLKSTLSHNLDVVARSGGAAEIIVGNFDEGDECQQWVEANFSSALQFGLLRFERFRPIPYWHFAWAKNAFASCLQSDYYSSLDGDNFLTAEELEATLEIVADRSRQYLIHHFSGQWGDGTSGRITFPTELYRIRPYVENTLPRQFDELAVILRLLAAHPDLVFVSRENVDILPLSKSCRDFIELNALRPVRWSRALGALALPINPRGEGYADADPVLRSFQNLNAAYTWWEFSTNGKAKKAFEQRLENAQRAYVRTPECYANFDFLFKSESRPDARKEDVLTLYAVNRGNYPFLQPWVEHYRRLGVERFIIVDDNSDPPLAECLGGDDIHFVTPRFGTFRTSKVFWLRALMGAFQQPGSWVLTADIDEFVDLHVDGGDEGSLLSQLTAKADEAGWQQFAGIMVDMMPAPDVAKVDSNNFIEAMNWYFYRPASRSFGYQDARSIKWAFGTYWPVSFSVDIRYRLFGTLDCLRKVPLLRYEEGVDLNQGFHTLWRAGDQLGLSELMPRERGLLPVRHYKMAKLFWHGDDGEEVTARADQYFDRTQQNLARMARIDVDYVRRCWGATPFKRRYSGARDFPHYHGPLIEDADG